MERFLFNHVLSRALGEAENVVKIVMKPSVSHRVILADPLPAERSGLAAFAPPRCPTIALLCPIVYNRGTGLFPEVA